MFFSYSMKRILSVLLTLSFILAMLCASGTASAGATYQVSAVGTEFQANGSDLHIKGVNDQTVVIYAMYPYPTYDYRYSNHLFSSAGLGYIGDTLTKITSDNYTHFWWQYFYEIKALGLNAVRLGGFDWWGMSMLHSVWRTNQTLWHSVIDPMFSMANETGVYIIFCFGGDYVGNARFSKTDYTFGSSVDDPTSGSIFQTGSETYNDFVNYVGEVMVNYTNETSLLAWEAMNEPNSDNSYNTYWLPTYFLQSAAKSAFSSWSIALSAALIAKDHHHLIINGPCMGTFFGWGQTNFNQFNSGTWDCSDNHAYFSATDSYLVTDPKHWADDLGKPFFVGEVALNYPVTDPYYWYWPWYAGLASSNGISLCWLTLWNYPGYPVSAVTMAAIPGIPDSYWSNLTVIIPDTPVVVPDTGGDPLPDPYVPPMHNDMIASAISNNSLIASIQDLSIVMAYMMVAFTLAGLVIGIGSSIRSRR